MKRVIFNPGTKINLSTELNSLQTYVYDNAYSLLELLIEEPGVVCDTISGIINPSDTELKISFNGGSVSVYPGKGLTASGLFLFRDSSAGVGGAVSVPGSPASGLYYIYAKYSETPSDYISQIGGFLFNPSGTNTVETRNEDSVTTNFTLVLTETYSDIADNDGILLGSGYHNYNPSPAWTWSADSRSFLKIKSDNLPYEVLRKYGEFSNVGYFKTTKLGIQSDDESYTLWINNSGITTDSVMSASGIEYTYINRHAPGSETTFENDTLTASGHTILTNYNAISKGTGYNSSTDSPTAIQEFSKLFRHGIINLDGRTDGVNDRRIVTTLIPSQPGSCTSLSATLLEMSTDSKFSTQLNAALLNYSLKDIQVTQKSEATALVTTFYSEMQRVAADTGYSTMSGFYTYTGVVYMGSINYEYPTYSNTLTAAASGIVNGGYNISYSGLGFALASGNDYYGSVPGTFVYEINNTLTNLNTEAVSLERDRLSAATSVLKNTNRLELSPQNTRKRYRCRVSWTAPSLINNEEIKYYNVRIYKLNPLTYTTVPDTYSVNELEIDFNKVIELEDKNTYERKKDYQTISGGFTPDIVSSGILEGYHYSLLYVNATLSSNVRVGDIVKDDSTNDTFFLTKIYNTSGLQLDRKGTFASTASVYRVALESTITNTKFDFDIYADQYYQVYVRPVTEYDVAGPWSNGLQIITNSLTNSQSQTLVNIVDADEQLVARTNEIKNVVYSQKLSSQITTLQRQIDDTPSRASVDNLISRVTQLDTPA